MKAQPQRCRNRHCQREGAPNVWGKRFYLCDEHAVATWNALCRLIDEVDTCPTCGDTGEMPAPGCQVPGCQGVHPCPTCSDGYSHLGNKP